MYLICPLFEITVALTEIDQTGPCQWYRVDLGGQYCGAPVVVLYGMEIGSGWRKLVREGLDLSGECS